MVVLFIDLTLIKRTCFKKKREKMKKAHAARGFKIRRRYNFKLCVQWDFDLF